MKLISSYELLASEYLHFVKDSRPINPVSKAIHEVTLNMSRTATSRGRGGERRMSLARLAIALWPAGCNSGSLDTLELAERQKGFESCLG